MTEDYTDTLKNLRAEIDAVDDQIISLLKARMGIIHRVSALKRVHTPAACHIRPGREGEMHRHIAGAFTDTDFPVASALTIWRQIIGASTHLESPITVALGGSEEGLSWHAREYFGRPVRCLRTGSVAESLAAVREKRATIALLPAPSAQHVSMWNVLVSDGHLRVFAALPVALCEGELPAAYAVADVQNESTGNDTSLLVLNPAAVPAGATVLASDGTHCVVSLPQFSTDPACVGAFPSPVVIPALQPW